MKTPVIIPAYNEERYIENTLQYMPADLVEPIVAANACTDRTVEIASSFGCRVLNLHEPGKMPAIQAALRMLGDQALSPILLLDGDAYPRFPRKWHGKMRGVLEANESKDIKAPVAVGGPVWLVEAPFMLRTLKSADRFARAALMGSRSTTETALSAGIRRMAYLGPNMGVRLTRNVLDEILAFPNYWPGEDKAIAYEVLKQDGMFHQLITPGAVTIKPAPQSLPPLREIARLGYRAAHQKMVQGYIDRAPEGSMPFPPPAYIAETKEGR